jgi:hypothetical protein
MATYSTSYCLEGTTKTKTIHPPSGLMLHKSTCYTAEIMLFPTPSSLQFISRVETSFFLLALVSKIQGEKEVA